MVIVALCNLNPQLENIIRCSPANEMDSAPRVRNFLRQGYDSAFSISGRIDTRSCTTDVGRGFLFGVGISGNRGYHAWCVYVADAELSTFIPSLFEQQVRLRLTQVLTRCFRY
jgi:hypothetical protein